MVEAVPAWITRSRHSAEQLRPPFFPRSLSTCAVKSLLVLILKAETRTACDSEVGFIRSRAASRQDMSRRVKHLSRMRPKWRQRCNISDYTDPDYSFRDSWSSAPSDVQSAVAGICLDSLQMADIFSISRARTSANGNKPSMPYISVRQRL